MIKTMIKRFLNSLLKHEGYVQDYRSKVRLPFYLESVLIGLILSDGFFRKIVTYEYSSSFCKF